MGRREDLTGMSFGMLTVVGYSHSDRKWNSFWSCKCSCGGTRTARMDRLKALLINNCGCVRAKTLKSTAAIKHKRIHRIWRGMKERCGNENAVDFSSYGAVGISVCDEWLDFDRFLEWSLANGYNDNLTIDRIDNGKGYSPSNCRWATYIQQANNRTNNVVIEYYGERLSVSQWAKIFGISTSTIYMRRHKGWTDEECLFGRDTKS